MILTNQIRSCLLFVCFLGLLVSTADCYETPTDMISYEFGGENKSTSVCTLFDLQLQRSKLQYRDQNNLANHQHLANSSMKSPLPSQIQMSHCYIDSNHSQKNETNEQQQRKRSMLKTLLYAMYEIDLLTILTFTNIASDGAIMKKFLTSIQGSDKRTKKFFKKFLKFDKNKVNKASIKELFQQVWLYIFMGRWMNYKSQINHDKLCAICIDNKTSVRLNCNHLYHYTCILRWIVKKSSCPLCSISITRMTLFCKKCMMKKKDLRLKQVENELSLLNQHCENCS